MGDIWDVNKLALFLAFFIPGFIPLQVYGLFVGIDDTDITKRLRRVIGYSAIHYAVTGWLLFVVPARTWRAVAAYLVVLVFPILWPPVILLVRDLERWKPVFLTSRRRLNVHGMLEAIVRPEASPWDRVLTTKARYIRLRLKSGRYVGGYFGPGSSVSTFPSERQIYVALAYTLDDEGRFGTPIARTGVLVQGDEIETLETIELSEVAKEPI